jgi:hypothetical protein
MFSLKTEKEMDYVRLDLMEEGSNGGLFCDPVRSKIYIIK